MTLVEVVPASPRPWAATGVERPELARAVGAGAFDGAKDGVARRDGGGAEGGVGVATTGGGGATGATGGAGGEAGGGRAGGSADTGAP